MEALYKLFALSFIAEREAYALVLKWENFYAEKGAAAPRYETDDVYKNLVDLWDEAHKQFKDNEKRLLKEYRKQKAEGTFTVMSGS